MAFRVVVFLAVGFQIQHRMKELTPVSCNQSGFAISKNLKWDTEPRIWNCRIYFDALHRLTSLSSTWGTVLENLIEGFSAV
ncbi:uncharacterized protein Bfra_006025 [Botrytis fragariae]|uniref:Uncharacterized protein n=1 Tax=Botrytis fragariae TaxID=1964551 RepID=A0A8H6ARU3_9HELO|nr:uncharacterized protein Bfra_006025 [Botrytis fragariae]KAF5872663.1 hypothetical protein Bfra_006025 [Botrytis fragariae]